MERHKDMWKLLYNLVNRSENDLSGGCDFIDEILCREPSLITQSLNERINHFQDTFVLWLIHKLNKALNFNQIASIQDKYKQTQCKLLNSCLVNRPKLFKQLTLAYVQAMEQLIETYANIDILSDKQTCLSVTAFTTTDCCLKEVDKNFQFPQFQVDINQVDEFAQALLQILQHAMCVGFQNYPNIFIDSALIIFKTIKECDITTKLLCLKYVNQLFESVTTLNETLQGIYELTLRTLIVMWEQMPLWLKHNCLTSENYDDAVKETCSLLKILQTFQLELLCQKLILKHSFTLMQHVLQGHHSCSKNNTQLMENIINFIFSLIYNCEEVKHEFTMDNCLLICQTVATYPTVMRLVALIIGAGDVSKNLLQFVYTQIVLYADKSNLSSHDNEVIVESLACFIKLEHFLLWKEQLSYIRTTHGCELIKLPHTSSIKQLLLDMGLSIEKLSTNFKKIVVKLKRFCSDGISDHSLKLAGLLLKSTFLHSLLNKKTPEELLDFILQPIKNSSLYTKQENLVIVSLDLLNGMYFKITADTIHCISSSMVTLAQYVYSTGGSYKLRKIFSNCLTHLLAIGWCKTDMIFKELKNFILKDSELFCAILKIASCAQFNGDYIIMEKFTTISNICNVEPSHWFQMEIICRKCKPSINEMHCLEEYLVTYTAAVKSTEIRFKSRENILYLNIELKKHLLNEFLMKPEYNFIGNHLNVFAITPEDCLKVINMNESICAVYLPTFSLVVGTFLKQNHIEFVDHIIRILYQQIVECLQTSQCEEKQEKILQVLTSCTENGLLMEKYLFQFFKLSFFFLAHPESKVVNEAIVCAIEMCILYKILPIQLWNWYKREAMALIIKLAVYVYLAKGVRITRSLKAFTYMLGFSCVQEFICKYYRLIVTMILPYCLKESRCKGLIVSISKITCKKVDRLFALSFLRIYSHIYFTEEVETRNACIELITKCTENSVSQLMNKDIKQTVSELLVYYNRNPTFVMQAFQCLLSQHSQSSEPDSYEFANFIANRFLGVITYFQTCLAEGNFERFLKEETLYSLGQIIRLIGPDNVTQFRFKIIAMLSFVLTLNDANLQDICLKIWNIFLHTVNIEELGPLLSRIVATLGMLLEKNKTDVNNIYEFLILKNDTLLGGFIPELYFIENMNNVEPSIKDYVKRQCEIHTRERNSFLDKLEFLYKQITNENVQVRIYGFQYLQKLFNEHREEVNRLILDVIRERDSLLEEVVNMLVVSCCHADVNVNLAAAKCLGELGAVDPSYLFSNYSFENCSDICLSIHTDDFAIWALTELCRAYQHQKDTKYVDNFSLAIQETLASFGVSPLENKKLNVWQAVPQRMRQVMEPLLNSCYTNSKREFKCSEHPLFLSTSLTKHDDWAFAWACRLIELVQNADTNHLLNSYKPSFKRDNKTLSLFFPYILLHALQECNEIETERIYEEFHAVYSFSSQKNETPNVNTQIEPESESFIYKEFPLVRYSDDYSISTDVLKQTSLTPVEFSKNWETCTKLCSEQIDFLQRWIREWLHLNMVDGKLSGAHDNYTSINKFLKKFNKLNVSKANYNAGYYMRALLYLEEYIEENTAERLQEQLSFLLEIHGKLMDADSMEGAVYLKKSNLTLTEEILVNRILDRPQETITCYEQLLSSEEFSLTQDDIKSMIGSYLRMDIAATALLTIDGLWQKLSDQYTDDYFKECKSEILWRLGRYDELEELLEDSVVRGKIDNWNIQCAEAFLLFRKPANHVEINLDQFSKQLDNIRSNVLYNIHTCVGVNEMAYGQCYDEAVRLHLLDEMEKQKFLINTIVEYVRQEDGRTEVLKESCLNEVGQVFNNWIDRLNVLPPVASIMEPVFCFRRNLLKESQRMLKHYEELNATVIGCVNECINEEIGKLWLRSVQMHRESGCLQQAQLSLMKAELYAPLTLFLEKAKLMWQKGDQTKAFKLLEENIDHLESLCSNNIRTLDVIQRRIYAEAKFLQASYNAESMNICSELNLQYFEQSLSGNRASEKCLVHLAQYQEKVFESYSSEQKDAESGGRLQLDIMVNYAKSLKYGYANVYQSLPRILSIWLDFTSQLTAKTESNAAELPPPSSSPSSTTTTTTTTTKQSVLHEIASKMNDLINNCNNILSGAIFYTALSQLLSRICHPSNDVYKSIRNIVIKLIQQFPQQSLWMLLPIFKSCHSSRIKRCRLIFTDTRLNNPDFQKLFTDFNMLAERLIELTNKDVAFDRTYELSSLVRQLPQLFQDPNFSEIMLPFEKYMQATFPIGECVNMNVLDKAGTPDANNCVPFNAFPHKPVYIRGIGDEVMVLRSAAKPKKISIECSDGQTYNVMVKPKDDLRKDCRLMEFNGLVKRYLHQDSQARHRRLRIRTYAAIPFNEECGLVEWLPRLNSFRSICMSIYRMRGLGIADRLLKQCALPKTETLEKKRVVFKDILLARHPPVFHEWFRQQFPIPNSWYQARMAYVKTIAVMSMVGYILGLGDRHGENVLFDETNGDAVHVDFNCLFNQGECFAYPEIVPFRLTHNMVFAMGPLGVEGLFRKCCEITLRVLKDEKKTLMSVLRPFVYDLGSLQRSKLKASTSTGLEITDPKAMFDVKRIEERLQGYIKKTLGNSIPLSTEGQVNFLINEAIDIDNLAAMYIGWGAYI